MAATPTVLDRTNYNALVDDTGANIDGSNWNKNQVKIVAIDPVDSLFSGAAPFYFGGAFGVGTYYPTTTGTQNDWDIDTANGFTVGHLYCNNATLLTINGIKPPTGNRLLFITSVGAGDVAIADQAGASTAADRIITGSSATLTLPAGTGRAVLAYDLTAARWRVVVSSVATSTGVVQTTTLTGTQNDVALTAGVTILRCNNASLLTLNGLAAGSDGQRVVIVSVGAGQVDLAHQNGGSTAANRLINFATSGNTSLAAGVGTAEVEYDLTTARWRLVAHEQGAYITPTYAGGTYTGNGAMTWTVDSGDVSTFAYYLKGRHLSVKWYLLNTTVGGTLNTALQITIPGGYTSAKAVLAMTLLYNDSGGTNVAGDIQTAAAGTVIQLFKITAANWTAATNTTNAFGEVFFEVQ